MERKNTNFIKILAYLLFFIMVGASLAVSAGEIDTMNTLSSPPVSTATNNLHSESGISLHSIWILVAGLIGFIAMSYRKGI